MADGLDRLLDGRRLSPVQRRIARYVAEHLHEAIFLSSVELAGRAGVSQPSVTRFAIALGFAGFPELRHALRPLVLNGNGGNLDENGGNLSSNGVDPNGSGHGRPNGSGGHGGPKGMGMLCDALDNEIRNLTRVRDRLGAARSGLLEPLRDLGTALAASEPLPVLGLRVSTGLATTFAYYARRVHPDVRLLAHGGSELSDGLHAARRAGAGWLLAIVLPRYPAEAVQALEQAQALGLRTAVIVDRPDVPFAADVVLDAPVGARLVFDSHAAPLALVMTLVEAMADAAPLRTQARLDEYARMTDRTGVFFAPNPADPCA